MPEWLRSSYQTKRKRSNSHSHQHNPIISSNLPRSKESDGWSRYEPNSGRRPHKISNGALRGNVVATFSSSSSSNSNIYPGSATSKQSQRCSGELPKALVEAYRNRARNKPNGNTAAAKLVELPQSICESLNVEQLYAVESVLQGRSVFFTGPAGCGKTHIINVILQLNEQVNFYILYFYVS